MDRDWNFHSFYRSPYLKLEMESKFTQREIYAAENLADYIGNFCAGLHDWFHGQRSHSFPPCSFFSADQRWTFFWKKPAHACILLGLCSVVLTSGSALEHDDRNGEKSGKETICCPYMDTAYPVIGDCRVWCVRLCKTGNRELYASENTVCILQF
mgnify:CR=1 FL=1